MNFEPSDDQRALQESLARWLDKHYGFTERKEVLHGATGMSDEAWATYAEMGLLGLVLPDADGGLGGAWSDFCGVMQRLGASLALEPVLPTALAARLVADAGSAAQRATWLGGVIEGRTRLALAHAEPGARHARLPRHTTAQPDGRGGWVLHGHKAVVVGAPQAQALVVSAAAPEGVALFVIDAAAPGLILRPVLHHDGQRAAELHLASVRVPESACLAVGATAAAALEQALDRGAAAVCAEAVGIMQAMLDTTLEYLKTRKQFGVTIGSFQALQHRMADMVVAQGQAASMALLAAVKADVPDAAERGRAVAAAKAYVGQQARFVGQQSIQLHGGMGITDEMKVSHLFRRLTLIEAAFGDTDHHFERFARTLQAA